MLHLERYYIKSSLELANKYPMASGFARLLIDIYSKYGVEDYYRHKRFVTDYPEMLFRAGKKEGFVNEQTCKNICVMHDVDIFFRRRGYVVKKFGDENKELFNEYMQRQKIMFAGFDEAKKVTERLRFFDMAADEMDSDQEITENTINVLETMRQSEFNVMPIAGVIHVDEEYPHVHFLYMLDETRTLGRKELKKIPHIENILPENMVTVNNEK